MPSFIYQAIDASGTAVRGQLNAASEVDALEALARQGLTATDIQSGTAHVGPWWQRELRLGGDGFAKPQDLLPAFTALATLADARMPLPEAVGFLSGHTSNSRLSAEFSQIRDALENGRSLRAALEEANEVIPERIRRLLTLGEAANQLPEVIARIVEQLQSEIELRSEIRSALVYPIILLVMSALVMTMLVFFLVPTLLPVFQTAGVEPPVILSAFDAIRVTLLNQGGLMLAGTVVLTLALAVFRKRVGRAFRSVAVRTPGLGRHLRKLASLSLCRSLALLVRSGMSALEGIQLATSDVSFPAWRAALEDARDKVEAGVSLPDALAELPFLDETSKSLIRVGDQTDRLADMLEASSTALRTETTASLKRSVALLTPILTLVIGGVIGFLIMSTVTAILDLNEIIV